MVDASEEGRGREVGGSEERRGREFAREEVSLCVLRSV